MGLRVIPRNLNERQKDRVLKIGNTDLGRASRVANRISDRRANRGIGEGPTAMKTKVAMGQPMKKGGKIIKKAQMGKVVDKYKSFVKKGKDDAAYTKKTFKTADSLRSANPKVGPKGLKGMLDERASNRMKADSLVKTVEKRVGVPRNMNLYDNKNGGKIKKK